MAKGSSNTIFVRIMSATVGCRTVEVHEPELDERFPTLVMYPSTGTERPTRFGPYTIDVSVDGPLAHGHFPLVVVSHGTGGSHLTHRLLGAHLARNGFIVALPEHPRNNRNNNELAGTAAILANRPRHLHHVIEWVHADDTLRPALTRSCVAVIGHSLGGYTALALAGGRPTSLPHESPDGQAHAIVVTPDARVQSLVLLAPATPWFMAAGALEDVRVPVLMYSGDMDPHTNAFHTAIVQQRIGDPSLVEHRVVQGAGHYAFLSPFPPEMTNPGFAPSQDPTGFDRVSFHERLYGEVVTFLQKTLTCS